MKTKICMIIFLVIIINYVYSSEEHDFYNFIDDIIYELQRVREWCIMDMSGTYKIDEHYQIIGEYKKHFLNISIQIKNNKILFNENESIKKILIIVDYEINNILNINNHEINSQEIFKKVEIMIDLMFSIHIIKYYEPLIFNYNL